MNVLLVISNAPYGSEQAYNALRLATALQREHKALVRIFLLADAVTLALPHQSTPEGYYNLERMLQAVIAASGEVKVCGSCARARGIHDVPLIEGAEVSTMSQLARWVMESDRVLTF